MITKNNNPIILDGCVFSPFIIVNLKSGPIIHHSATLGVNLTRSPNEIRAGFVIVNDHITSLRVCDHLPHALLAFSSFSSMKPLSRLMNHKRAFRLVITLHYFYVL